MAHIQLHTLLWYLQSLSLHPCSSKHRTFTQVSVSPPKVCLCFFYHMPHCHAQILRKRITCTLKQQNVSVYVVIDCKYGDTMHMAADIVGTPILTSDGYNMWWVRLTLYTWDTQEYYLNFTSMVNLITLQQGNSLYIEVMMQIFKDTEFSENLYRVETTEACIFTDRSHFFKQRNSYFFTSL